MTVIGIPDEHTTKGLGGKLASILVFQTEVCGASDNLEVKEVSMGAMKNTVGQATRATGGSWRRKLVAKVNSRAQGKALIL
jgi:hypothetical protein